MKPEVSLDELSVSARRAGLKLSDADLERLRAAMARSRAQAAQLRELISESVEPAAVFGAKERAEK
jgi:hypothetical protein